MTDHEVIVALSHYTTYILSRGYISVLKEVEHKIDLNTKQKAFIPHLKCANCIP